MVVKAKQTQTTRKSESELWSLQKTTAEESLDFVIAFLGCASNGIPLDRTGRNRLLTILRAVSFVESRHGTAGSNEPARDPLQCGNPRDSWWKAITGQSGNGDRIVRGPGLRNLWARELTDEAERTPGFPSEAAIGKLSDKAKGHRDAGFTPHHSYLWGVIYLIHRINTAAGEKTFECGDLARDRLIDGAVEYNGGGDPNYRTKIESALKEIGDLSLGLPVVIGFEDPFVAAPRLVGELIAVAAVSDGRPVKRVAVEFDPQSGRISATEIEFV